MASNSRTKYNHMKVTKPVSVTPVEAVSGIRDTNLKMLIMGPTGAGKSSFIEALGLKGTSKISSNGLDGCTQSISTYRLDNVTAFGRIFYLVDSPGFADSQISEFSIVTMLPRCIEDNGLFNWILYFMPITSVRLPGSQRQVLKTFQAISGVKAACNITIVTTMWDTIWGEGPATRAEQAYEQLQDDIWKDYIEAGAQIARFYNTEESALTIIYEAFTRSRGQNFSIEDYSRDIKGGPFAGNLLIDLQNRIQNLHFHIPTLHDELAHAEAQGDELLASTLRPRLQEAENNLARFSKELDDSGLLPPPSPLSSAPAPVSEDTGPSPPDSTTKSVPQLNHSHPTQPSSIPLPIGVQDNDNSPSIPTPISNDTTTQSTFNTNHAIVVENTAASPCSLTETPSTTRPAVQEDQPAPQQQLVPLRRAPGRFVRLMEILKCWGDASGERHED